MFEKIENCNNAVEFLFLKALFYTLQSLRISNWKIISHEIKQLNHLLKTMRNFAWSRYLQKLVSVWVVRRFIFSFFANQIFSRHRKAELLRKWIALVLPSKSKRPSIRKQMASSLSSKSIVLVFTKQPSAERYLASIFFQYFRKRLENSSSASKYVPKSFRKFTKNTRGKVLC